MARCMERGCPVEADGIDGKYCTLHKIERDKRQRKFDGWMRNVNKAIESICGLTADDLADCPFADWFEDGIEPNEAAQLVLEENGF